MYRKFIRNFCACVVATCLFAPGLSSAETSDPVNIRAAGGSVMGGTWNVAFTALGKLLRDMYPGSTVNVLLGASLSNPLKIESNGADLTATQSFNIRKGLKGEEPFKKPLKEIASIGNVNDTTVIHIIASPNLKADSLEEIIEQKMPIRLDPGQKGTLHFVLGEEILKELGASYDDIKKWGGSVTPVSGADRPGMMQDGTINVCIFLGSLEQAQLREMVTNSHIKWLTVKPETLQKVADKAGLGLTYIPGSLYGGAVGKDVPTIADTVHIIVRKDMSDEDAYKITKTLAEGHEYISSVQPAWKSLKPETMPQGLAAPLHPGAEKYYREKGLIKE